MRCRIESIGCSLPAAITDSSSIRHAVNAAQSCMSHSNHPLENIDLLINTGVYRDKHIIEPAMAAFIQNELNLNTDFSGKTTFSFDLINGASGMLCGIQVAISAIKSGTYRVGLVVSSDASPDLDFTYLPSGSAVLIDASPNNIQGFGSFYFSTFEQHSNLYQGIVSYREKGGKSHITKKEGLEDACLQCAAQVFQELLKNEGLSAESIDLIFSTQVSADFMERLPVILGVAEDKAVNILPLIKEDTLTTSPFIAFDYAEKNGMIKAGSRIIFLTVGSGITAGAAIYDY